jgi:hypothetical protein
MDPQTRELALRLAGLSEYNQSFPFYITNCGLGELSSFVKQPGSMDASAPGVVVNKASTNTNADPSSEPTEPVRSPPRGSPYNALPEDANLYGAYRRLSSYYNSWPLGSKNSYRNSDWCLINQGPVSNWQFNPVRFVSLRRYFFSITVANVFDVDLSATKDKATKDFA